MSQTLTDILVVIAAVFLVWLVIRLFRKPIRWILKLLLNTAIGFAALFLLNFFGSATGITLGLNWINALVIGVTGFPGLVLLLLIKYLF
jgi:pro-sigmaK processing inhibitor bofA